MADQRLKNIAGLFKEGRTRTILLITLFVLIVAVVIGVFSIHGRVKGTEASAGVTSAPGSIESIPFNAPNAEYAHLQEEQNKQKAKQAEQTGGSAIPTIIRSGNDNDTNAPAVSDTGLGFSGLSREQSDAGTFNAKEFGVRGKNCPIASQSPLGTPIFDKNGRLIGYLGADGKVRDINGKVIGTVGPDGIVRDASGNVIGQSSRVLAGTPIYDAKSCSLIGRVSEDGQVRDVSGKIPGVLGADGILRGTDGSVLGQAGTPAYTPEGKLIGFGCTDGKVRDENGNVIGTIGPDGVVRDLNGNIIGRAGAISPGTPIYGPDGKIIGYLGPDGKVRDANGNIIGTLGADGKLRDANGNIIGSIVKPTAPVTSVPIAGATSGVPIYGPDGKIIGFTGADGKVRDANGNIIGTVGADGTVRDSNGKVIASVAKPEEAKGRRRLIADQDVKQQLTQAQQSMTAQANQMFAAWASPSQQYVHGQDVQAVGGQGGQGGNSASGANGQSGSTAGPVFIKAGTVYYGVINTAVDSDEPGPIMATIVNGPYKGGKLLGTLTYQKQAVMLSFNIMTLKSFPKSIPINVVAIDQDTARTGLSTETNNHYLYRYGSIFAAAFIQGYGQAFQTSGSTITSNGLSTQSSTPDLSPVGKFFVALGNVGQQFNNVAQQAFNTPPTVRVASGTAVGLLFLSDATMPN
ncbi:MAG TPA: TrbI/VirB10 family protein [Gammaproteobacteria bacterium]|nr:TrbI/VirB10 family protein [Gammaproteobacteria bacterium]